MEGPTYHKFHSYLVRYLNSHAKEAPVCHKLDEPRDIVDLLGLLEDAIPEGLAFGNQQTRYDFSMVVKQGKKVTIHGERPGTYAVAIAQPAKARIFVHPDPGLSHVRVSGRWLINLRHEDQDFNTVGYDDVKSEDVFIWAETGSTPQILSAVPPRNYSREDVYDYAWERFIGLANQISSAHINRYHGERLTRAVSRTHSAQQQFMEQIDTPYPIIQLRVNHRFPDGDKIDEYLEYLAGNAFSMPSYIHSKLTSSGHDFQIMLEIP